MRYFDAHCHVQFDDYADDQATLLERMREREIGGVVVGVDQRSSEEALDLAERHDELWAAVGTHPNRIAQEPFDHDFYAALARHPKVVAVGECGLDYYRPSELTSEVKRAQQAALRAHADLAAEFGKPLVIHARPSKGTQDAYRDLIAIVREKNVQHGGRLRGDVHFFVGGLEEAHALFALDFTISFTAVITFAHEYDAVIRAVPLERILSETDAPYVAPASRRHERNDPLAVEEVVRRIAEIRGEDEDAVREAILANARGLFGV